MKTDTHRHQVRWARAQGAAGRQVVCFGELVCLPNTPSDGDESDFRKRVLERTWQWYRGLAPRLQSMRLSTPHPVRAMVPSSLQPVEGGYRLGFHLFPLDEVRGLDDAIAVLWVNLLGEAGARRLGDCSIEVKPDSMFSPRNRRQILLAGRLAERATAASPAPMAGAAGAAEAVTKAIPAPGFAKPLPVVVPPQVPPAARGAVIVSSREILVAPDDDLAVVMAAAPAGSRIRLGRGVHVLKKPLRLSRGVELVGEGTDQTHLGGIIPGVFLIVDSLELVRLRNLSLVRATRVPGDLVACVGGRLEVDHCYFGAACKDWTGRGGVALRAVRGARLRVRDVWFDQHDVAGILLDAGCEAEVSGARFTGSEAGVRLREDAHIELGRCLFENLREAGVLAEGSARVVLGDCEFKDLATGIVLEDNAHLSLSASRFLRCAEVGLQALSYAQVEVEGCGFRETKRAGVLMGERAGGRVADCSCQYAASGIAVAGYAAPLLERNDCQHNSVGIKVGSTGGVRLRENQISRNHAIGIWFQPGSTGLAVANRCQANGHGILIGRGAEPELLGNDCSGNRIQDVLFQQADKLDLGTAGLRAAAAPSAPPSELPTTSIHHAVQLLDTPTEPR